jgi:hypothetical protein
MTSVDSLKSASQYSEPSGVVPAVAGTVTPPNSTSHVVPPTTAGQSRKSGNSDSFIFATDGSSFHNRGEASTDRRTVAPSVTGPSAPAGSAVQTIVCFFTDRLLPPSRRRAHA